MLAVLSLIMVIVISLLVVRIATVAMTLTGLSRDLASFQCRSAFTGTGITTSETELVVQHPVRRRIVMVLMLLGNAGIVTAVATLMLSFAGGGADDHWTDSFWFRMLVLVAAMIALWIIAMSKWVDRRLSTFIGWALTRWTDIDARDYAALLHLSGEYGVSELQVQEGDWLTQADLSRLALSEEGVLVLGVERADGTYIGAPRGNTRLRPGDTVIIYGRQHVFAELDTRPAGAQGNRAHVHSVLQQSRIELAEAKRQQPADIQPG